MSYVLIMAAAFALAVTCCLPWAHITLLHTVDTSIPGVLFQGGGCAFAAAVAILLLLRRSPIACFIAAIFVYGWIGQAVVEVPRRVKHQVIGVQLSLFPVNRLLDQFHLPDIEFANWSGPNSDLLSPAITWSVFASEILLASSLIGIPSDPVILWVARRVARAKCRACGAQWKATRDVRFCYQCGTPTDPRRAFVCPRCGEDVRTEDLHCVHCGILLTFPAGTDVKRIV